MSLIQTFLIILLSLSCILLVTTAQDYDALTNIQLGMQGLMQAGSDPAMLAQLMQDMQVCFFLYRYIPFRDLKFVRFSLFSVSYIGP
jgi:hypothetical protein